MRDGLFAVLLGLAQSVLVRELLDNSAYVAERLIAHAVQRLPQSHQSRMAAVWEAELEYLRVRRGRLRVIAWALRVYVGSSALARELAPLSVTAGTIGIYWDGSEGGFSLSGPNLSVVVAHDLHLMLGAGRDLRVGTLADVSETQACGGRGAAVINGTAYTSRDLVWFRGPLRVKAEPFVITDQGPIGTFKTPFELTGSIAGFSEHGPNAEPLFTTEISGRGTLTLTLRRYVNSDGAVRYGALGTGYESLVFSIPCLAHRWYRVPRKWFAAVFRQRPLRQI